LAKIHEGVNLFFVPVKIQSSEACPLAPPHRPHRIASLNSANSLVILSACSTAIPKLYGQRQPGE
jgi:hypothetical protein